MKKYFIYSFIILLFFTCTKSKDSQYSAPPICVNDDDCTDYKDNNCMVNKCTNGLCSYDKLENKTSCGESKVCIDGVCLLVVSECETNEDCPNYETNDCKNSECTENLCIIKNIKDGVSCDDGQKSCINGYCSSTCLKENDCFNNNTCVNSTCNNIPIINNILVYSDIVYNNGVWWLADFSNKKVYKYNTNWEYLDFSFDIVHNTSFNNIFSKEELIYIQSSDHEVNIYNYSGTLLNTVNFRNDSNIPEDLRNSLVLDNFYYDGTYWWIFGSYIVSDGIRNSLVYKLNDNFNYISHLDIDFSPKKISYDGSYWYISTNGYSFNLDLKKYDLNFNEIGTIYSNNNLGVFSSIFLANDTWTFLIFINVSPFHSKIFQFTKDFIPTSFCKYTELENGTTCESGFCNNGFCCECSSNNQCEDENICTNDFCNYGICLNENLDNGTLCGEGKICRDGNCISANCIENSDCPSDNFCIHNYCGTNNECSFNNLNENKFCDSEYGYLFTCNNGICSFDPQDIGLCSEPQSISQDKPHGIIVSQEALSLNSGEELFGVAGKFEDGGIYKCGNATYIPKCGLGIVFALQKDNPDTPEKDGFLFLDTIYFYIRTTNYVCRVSADFDPEFYGTNRWGSLGLSRILNFKNYNSDPGTDINFTDTNHCTLISN